MLAGGWQHLSATCAEQHRACWFTSSWNVLLRVSGRKLGASVSLSSALRSQVSFLEEGPR